jgi:apolipoprotein N-acyltransferase
MVPGFACARNRRGGLRRARAVPGETLGRRFLRAGGFAIAGLAQAASIGAPWSGQPLWWLQLISLVALVWQLDALGRQGHRPALRPPVAFSTQGRRPDLWPLDGFSAPDHPAGLWRRAAAHGWIFATAWLCGTFWWLFISLHVFGGLAAPLAVLAVLALAGGLSIYYAAACAIFVAVRPRGRVTAAVLFAALWTLAELLRGSWFTGFPWGAGGYAHLDGPLAGYAPWLGVYGIGAVGAALAAMAAMAARMTTPAPAKTWMPCAAVAGALVLAPMALNPWRAGAGAETTSRGVLDIELLQGNIPQDEKFIPGAGIETALEWYGVQLRDARASLVITPETALPLLPEQLPPGYLEAVADRFSSGSQAAIVGIPLEGEAGGGTGRLEDAAGPDYGDYRNAVLGFQPGMAVPYRYEKHHLVPFGEFVPGMFRWFTNMLNIPLGDFHRGSLAQAPFVWRGQRIATNICYEDLFGDEIGANFRDPARAPTILLNVSNIAWFGDSIAIDQHRSISRMRSLEFERPMVRATNTGATAVIDHRGRTTHELPRLTRGVLAAQVEGRDGLTPFAWWVSRWGLGPLWGVSLLVVAVAIGAGARRRVRAR